MPIEGKTPTEVLAKHVAEAPTPLATHGLTVPRKVGALVVRCLAKDPEHRPDSAMTLAGSPLPTTRARKHLISIGPRLWPP